MNADAVSFSFDSDSQLLQARERRGAVGRGGEILELTYPFGDAAEQRQAVADRFVAGKGEASVETR